MGKAVTAFAHDAGLAEQKSELEKQQLTLASQLQEGVQTRLIPLQGDESRKTAVASAGAQGAEARSTAEFANNLPLSPAQKAENDIKQFDADTRRLDADKPIAGGFTGSFLVRSKETGEWEVKGSTASPSVEIDKNSNNLTAQTGLSQGAINIMTGQTKGQRTTAAQTKAYNDEIAKWGIANGINTNTLAPQVEAQFNVLKYNIQRNNQANILENELLASIETASPVLDAMNAGKIKIANLVDVWAGKEVNDPNTIKAADQLSRLRQELAGYNAVAGGHLMENGTPAPTPENFHEAERTISNGINSGGLKALEESVSMSAAKNRNILEKAIDNANKDYYKLFNATYRPPNRAAEAGHTDKPPPSAKDKLPAGVPEGSRFSPSRKQWKAPDGKLYDEYGAPAKADAAPSGAGSD